MSKVYHEGTQTHFWFFTLADAEDKSGMWYRNGMSVIDFEWLTEASPVQIWTARPDGALDYVNAKVTQFFGRSAEQMLGEGWLSFLHPADVTLTIERWTRSITHGESYSMEFRLLRAADRQYCWHLAQAEPVRDAGGKIVGWVGSNTDINGLKRMVEIADARQEMVRRERDRLLRAYQALPAAVALYAGPNFVIEMANPQWLAMAGKGDVVGRPFRDVFSESGYPGLVEQMERVYATGDPFAQAELPLPFYRAGSPAETYWNVVIQPIGEPNGPYHELLSHALDVTASVQARRAAHA